MNRTKALRILNPALAVLFVSQAGTGIFGGHLPSDEWFYWIHGKGGYLLVAVALTHLALNWNWVKTQFFKKRAGA